MGQQLARFVAFHEVSESDYAAVAPPIFSITLARSSKGVVFVCDVDAVPEIFSNEETGAITTSVRGNRPQPLGDGDAAMLNRFG